MLIQNNEISLHYRLTSLRISRLFPYYLVSTPHWHTPIENMYFVCFVFQNIPTCTSIAHPETDSPCTVLVQSHQDVK